MTQDTIEQRTAQGHMSSPTLATLPLSAIIGAMLARSNQFTDIHVESNMPVMLRTSAGEWIQAVDSAEAPIMVSHQKILAFVSGIFTGKEEVRPPQAAPWPWETEFREAGSLHPATVLYTMGDDGTPSTYRVRCTIQRQSMGESIGLVIRALHGVPESIMSLGLPLQVNRMISTSTNGLIVVTGPTGSGKSTSMAAMIEEINSSRSNNILTIEDPIEFEFERKRSIINQRELYVDVPSFESGVRDALRFVPDVIMVGEIRDEQTMRAVLRAAESGHLVLTSMHAPTAVAAIRKMLSYLDSGVDAQALAGCLVGIIAQGLVQAISGQKKETERANCLAYEVLNCKDQSVITAITSSARGQGDQLAKIEERLRSNDIEGSTPMAQSLRSLISRGLVDARKAAVLAYHPADRSEFMRAANPPPVAPR